MRQPITSWRDLGSVLAEAEQGSNAEPLGSAEITDLGGIKRVEITVDLVPRDDR